MMTLGVLFVPSCTLWCMLLGRAGKLPALVDECSADSALNASTNAACVRVPSFINAMHPLAGTAGPPSVGPCAGWRCAHVLAGTQAFISSSGASVPRDGLLWDGSFLGDLAGALGARGNIPKTCSLNGKAVQGDLCGYRCRERRVPYEGREPLCLVGLSQPTLSAVALAQQSALQPGRICIFTTHRGTSAHRGAPCGGCAARAVKALLSPHDATGSAGSRASGHSRLSSGTYE